MNKKTLIIGIVVIVIVIGALYFWSGGAMEGEPTLQPPALPE